jgi:hypothetical protein
MSLRANGVLHTIEKLSTRVTTLFYTSPQLEVWTQSYGTPKLRKSQFWEFHDFHLGVSRQNDIWVLVPWPSTKYNIRGKVVASPKSRPWWVLWVRGCPWLIHAPNCSNYTLTDLLFGLCRSVWISEFLVNIPSPNLELQHALPPPKCYEPWNV